MEFLQNPIVIGLMSVVGLPLVLYLWNLLLPRKTVYGFFRKIGAIVRTFSFEKVGDKQAGKMLDVVCNTLTDIFQGLLDGVKGVKQEDYPE